MVCITKVVRVKVNIRNQPIKGIPHYSELLVVIPILGVFLLGASLSNVLEPDVALGVTKGKLNSSSCGAGQVNENTFMLMTNHLRIRIPRSFRSNVLPPGLCDRPPMLSTLSNSYVFSYVSVLWIPRTWLRGST